MLLAAIAQIYALISQYVLFSKNKLAHPIEVLYSTVQHVELELAFNTSVYNRLEGQRD